MFDTWITEPPVEMVDDPDKVQVICTQFNAEIRKSERPATDEEAEWEDRKSRAEGYAGDIKKSAANEKIRDQFIFCVYKPGKVVGLMSWWKPPLLPECFVCAIAMLPGRESEAAILIEYGVNLSKRAGYDGRICFSNWNSGAHSYQWLQSEYVVPRESDEWVEVRGQWRLVKFLPMQLDLQRALVRLLQREIGGSSPSVRRAPFGPKL